MAINWRVLTIGALTMGLGSWFSAIGRSNWVHTNLAKVAEFFAGLTTVNMFLVIVGSVILAFGLLWGRWLAASILGLLFAVGAFAISFW